MEKKKKNLIIISIIAIVLLLSIGITYAAFNYTKTGTNSELVLGDVYMHYQENNALLIENAMPGSDYSNYFEFTITGKNTYTKQDIWYDFVLTIGDVPVGKIEENRIPDKYLKFKLVSVDASNQETVLLEDKTYVDLANRRIYVETIAKNTTDEVNRKYRLYMTIDESLEIGNNETAVFSIENWNHAFASVKVNVTGDFNEKILIQETDASCFNAGTIVSDFSINTADEEVAICAAYLEQQGLVFDTAYGTYEDYCKGTNEYNSSLEAALESYLYDNENYWGFEQIDINYFIDNNIMIDVEYEAAILAYDETCGSDVVIPSTIDSYTVSEINANALIFNKLTDNNVMNSTEIEISCDIVTVYGAFTNLNLNSLMIPNTIKNIKAVEIGNFLGASIEKIIFEENSSLTTIVSYAFSNANISNIVIPDSVTAIEKYAFRNSQIKNLSFEENSSLTTIVSYAFENANISNIVIPDSVTAIEKYAFLEKQIKNLSFEENSSLTAIGEYTFSGNNLTSVEIPNSVETIGSSAFSGNNLTSVKIPNSVTTIEDYAFSDNDLTSVELPNSVTTIGNYAFSDNNLQTITIGNGIQKIGKAAFEKTATSNLNLTSITINRTCSNIKNIGETIYGDCSTYFESYYPWLSDVTPYTASDVTIYGTDGVCDTF